MRSSLAAILRNFVIPFEAGPTDNAVILEGQPEAILTASDQEAAVIWQYSPDLGVSRRAFILSVEPSPGPVFGGELHLFATDFTPPLFDRQFIDLFQGEDGSGGLTLCAQTVPIDIQWSTGVTNRTLLIGTNSAPTPTDEISIIATLIDIRGDNGTIAIGDDSTTALTVLGVAHNLGGATTTAMTLRSTNTTLNCGRVQLGATTRFDDIKAVDPSNSANQETWHTPSYVNGWAAQAGVAALQYRKLASPAGAIQLSGCASGGTSTDGTTVFTLPAGYRPATTHVAPSAPTGRITIDSAGAVKVFGFSIGAFLQLETIVDISR